jgi:hypothetical protein
MLRLLMLISGVAFVAIVSLPGVSLGEYARHGFQSITAPYVPAQRGPGQGGQVQAPHAPELYPLASAKTTLESEKSIGTNRERPREGLSLVRNTTQPMSVRQADTDFVTPPVVPEPSVEPSMPQVIGSVLSRAFPDRKKQRPARSGTDRSVSSLPSPAPAVAPANAPAAADNEATSVSSIPTNNQGKYKYLEIEVGYDTFIFKLFGVYESGQKDLLKECKVALGARGDGFDTPVGVYFVTHIYDDHPLWIPPPDRPWAWGQSISKTVYGGTMAPLLKKRPVSYRNKGPISDDYIEEQVKLDDNGYRFHGTNQPKSIGHRASHGCVRMRPEDAREVANLIKDYVGAPKRGEAENGTFAVLRAPVRLTIVK